MSAYLLTLWASSASRGGQEAVTDFSLMDAIGGRALQQVADMPDGTHIEFLLMKPGQFVPGEVGQKLYLFSFGNGWFQIRNDIPFDLWPGGGLRHFHVTELLPVDLVFAKLGLEDVEKYRGSIYNGRVEDPRFLHRLGLREVEKGALVIVDHDDGWKWSIATGNTAPATHVDTEAWYKPHADLGAALAVAGITVMPGDIGTSAGARFLGKVRSAAHLVKAGLVGLRDSAEVIVEAAGSDEWRVRGTAIGFPLSVRVGADRLEKFGIEDMMLLRIPAGQKVDGRVVSSKLARKVGLARAVAQQRVSIGFEESARMVRLGTDDEQVELGLDTLLAAREK